MSSDRTVAQEVHRLLALAALGSVAITLFLVGLAAFRHPEPPATARPTPARQAVPAPDTRQPVPDPVRQLEAVRDQSDTAIRRVVWALLAILVIAIAMLGLAALGQAPAVFARLSGGLVALSALNAALVLTRDVAVELAALQALTITMTLVAAARILGRHSLLDSPWHGVPANPTARYGR
jgi:hypothetical protein